MKRAVVLACVLGLNALLGAQTPTTLGDVVHMSGGVHLSTPDNVQISADRAELNQKTGEMLLFGTVVLRQQRRPATQLLATTNQAGAPFPEPKQVTMRLSGDFQVSVGDLIVRAEEADLNGLTGELTLRGNVRITNPKWSGKPRP